VTVVSRTARPPAGRQDGADPIPDDTEDDVTAPGNDVPDADRAEQEAPLDPPAVALAGDATPPG
jgi:hypothetical protein